MEFGAVSVYELQRDSEEVKSTGINATHASAHYTDSSLRRETTQRYGSFPQRRAKYLASQWLREQSSVLTASLQKKTGPSEQNDQLKSNTIACSDLALCFALLCF